MKSSPPPLQLLPGFEAAARLLSFKKASEELNLTPSAISQQIKQLEDWLGHSLFHRKTRAIELTPTGESYYQIVATLLTQHHRAYDEFRKANSNTVIRVSAMTQIAVDILIPSLPAFRQQHPTIDVRIEASEPLVDFEYDHVDVAIRTGLGNWPNVMEEKLCDMEANVCFSPELAEAFQQQKKIDYQQITLIESRTNEDDWKRAGDLFNLDFSANKRLTFENYLSAVTAAENSAGALIVMLPITNKRMQQGTLQAIGGKNQAIQESCYLVMPKHITPTPELIAVNTWLRDLFKQL